MNRIECSSFVLLDERGNRLSSIADLLVGELVDEDGLKYQKVTMTIPLIRIQIPARLTIFDTAKNLQIFTFTAEEIRTQIEGEQFVIVNGCIYLAFPKNP